MAVEHEPAKIGQGHAQAMGRLGFKELAQALPAFPNSAIQPIEEPGLFGNPVPQEVFAQKQGLEIESQQDHQPIDWLKDLEIDPQKDLEMEM